MVLFAGNLQDFKDKSNVIIANRLIHVWMVFTRLYMRDVFRRD